MGCFHKVLPNVKSAYVTFQNFTPDLQKFYTDISAVSATFSNSDPWRAASFTKLLETTKPSQCPHCLPDCEATTYTVTTSSSPIRRCDSRNLNLNPFCSLNNAMKLAPWLDDVTKKYKDSGDLSVPNYVSSLTGTQRPWFAYEEDADKEMILGAEVSYGR